jgi:2-C-methyl-D-erythritol 4-phosphate cytidylyltransferase
MSDDNASVEVVAFVPVIGRVEPRASVVAQAIQRLAGSGVIDHIVVVPPVGESEMDIPAGAVLDWAAHPAPSSVRAMPDLATAVTELDTAVRVVLVYDPSRTSVSDATVRRVIDEVRTRGVPVVPVLPCSDTVKRLDVAGFVVDTPDRAGLRVIQSPIGYPADHLRSGQSHPDTVPVGAHVVPGDPA